jgi:TRAP-type mannitol/chloroaromatic compound transport system permease large subunit
MPTIRLLTRIEFGAGAIGLLGESLAQLGVNLVWIGVVTVVAVEVGLLTPPFGMAAFVVKSVLDDQSISLNDIFAGAFPFACVMVLVVIAVLAFPWLATGLLRAPAG